MGHSQLVLKMEIIDIDIQGHMTVWLKILGNLDFPRDKL